LRAFYQQRALGSDCGNQFGECCGYPLGGGCVGSEFVVAAAEVLHEGVFRDDYLCGPIRSQSSHGSEPALTATRPRTTTDPRNGR
jgi:hypothetical protein